MREIYYLDAIREAIDQQMEKDSSIFMIGEDIGIYGGAFGLSLGLLEKFGPDRIIDTPISEQAIVGMAIGSALMGKKPLPWIRSPTRRPRYIICSEARPRYLW